MPARPPRVCPGCRATVPPGECPNCRPEERRDSDRRRRDSPARSHDWGWQQTSAAFLREHRICVLCSKPSTVADHHPRTRRELIAAAVPDPDAWHRLRPLCKTCHDRHTARTTPGGWYARRLAVQQAAVQPTTAPASRATAAADPGRIVPGQGG